MTADRKQDQSPMRRIFNDAIATYWSITRHVGPSNRNDIFYARFAVVLLSLSQMVIILAVWSIVFGNLADWIGERLVTAAVFVLIIVLSIINGLLIFQTDDRLRRLRRRFRHHPRSFAITLLYFALAICSGVYLFS